jgi:2,5-furandicarboxylate decarboxylase 1
MERIARSIPATRVSDAPVQGVVRTGSNVDLGSMPIPVHSPDDGGRYLTAAVCLVRDPESGSINAGIYRTMVHPGNRLTIDTAPEHDLGRVLQGGRTHGKSIDVALVVGGHPAFHIASQAKVPIHVDSLGLMGSLLGAPVEVVKAKTVDLDVPAHAEIVIEGRIAPANYLPEGPFGEFSYYYGATSKSPVMDITAITHRVDPIYLDIHPAHPDHRCLWLFPGREARLLQMLRNAVPGVLNACLPFEAGGMVAHISMDKVHDGDVRRALMIALSSDVYIKHAMEFDRDIDIYSPGHTLWALSVRFQADADLMIIANARGFAEDPSSYSRGDRDVPGGLTTKSGFDATVPLGRLKPTADLIPERYAGLDLADYLRDADLAAAGLGRAGERPGR